MSIAFVGDTLCEREGTVPVWGGTGSIACNNREFSPVKEVFVGACDDAIPEFRSLLTIDEETR